MVIDSSIPPFQFSVESSFRAIDSCHTKKMFLEKSAMADLRSHLSFTQLRFYCSKQHGRTFHVTTVANSTGEAVLQYFSGQTDVQPDACGSFVRMENDNSLLTRLCHRWGKEGANFQVGKWGYGRNKDRLFNHPAFVQYDYHGIMRQTGSGRFECDDIGVEGQVGDAWRVFVR
ncbi:uncharacterized protein LOC110053971 [Orbicella faveolata]|nr:uncharacterized protein LOC110053971 [Orbicella faveolata]